MSPKQKILAASVFSIASILLIGFFGLNSIRKFDDSNKWVVHTREVISETQQIMVYCADVETSTRGYAITANSDFLIPYHEATSQIRERIRKLRKITADNKAQTAAVKELDVLINRKIAFSEQINAYCREKGKIAAQELIADGLGQNLMNQIRKKVNQIISYEELLLKKRTLLTERNYSTTYQLILFSLVGSVCILLFTFYLLLRDLKIRQANEKKIRDNELELKQFFDTIPIGIYIVDSEKKPYYANKKALELIGMEKLDKTKTVDLSNVRHASGEKFGLDAKPIGEIFGENSEIERNELVIERDGRQIQLSIRSVAVRDSDEQVSFVMSVVEDVSLQRSAEQELLRAKKFAEDSDKQKDIFLTNMSHEIRTPMNAIVGFTMLLGDTALTTEQEDYLDSIRIASGNLLHIINDILDLSKIQSGHINLESLPFNLPATLQNLSKVHLPEIEAKGLSLDIQVSKEVPEMIEGDPARLKQVLTNLLGNAMKFSHKGSIRIVVEKLSEAGETIDLQFTVSDEGIGIDADKLPFIFDRFTQADFDTNRLYGGTGLGLNITKSLVEKQNGHISVESTKGKGTTFRFVLPFKKTAAPETTPSPGITQQETKRALEILLVEDNPLNQKLALRVMKDFGYHLDTADNGRVALEKVKAKKYDLILMDLQMPELDGYKTAEILRKEYKLTTPIIAMTAHSLAGERDKCLEAGMNDYISKPFKFEQLKLKIDLAMKGSGALNQAENATFEEELKQIGLFLEQRNFMESKMQIFKLKAQLIENKKQNAAIFSTLEELIRRKAEWEELREELRNVKNKLGEH